MRRLETQTLEGFNDTPIDAPTVFEVSVGDRKIDYATLIKNTPAVTTTYDGYHEPQLILSSCKGLPNWDESTFYPVGRLNNTHGRTLQVLADDVYVKDQFGNEYRSLAIKGCDLSDPRFIEHATAARGYIIKGLQESIVMERVLRASKTLRANGVDTEYICGLSQPETFPTGKLHGLDTGTNQTLPELLEKLATDFAFRADEQIMLHTKFVVTATGNQIVPPGEIAKEPLEVKSEMIDRFKDCDYLISYRGMDCPSRLGELSVAGDYGKFQQFIDRRFEGNVREFTTGLEPEQYIKSYLAYKLGSNVARMHNIGLRHGFLTPHNIPDTPQYNGARLYHRPG